MASELMIGLATFRSRRPRLIASTSDDRYRPGGCGRGRQSGLLLYAAWRSSVAAAGETTGPSRMEQSSKGAARCCRSSRATARGAHGRAPARPQKRQRRALAGPCADRSYASSLRPPVRRVWAVICWPGAISRLLCHSERRSSRCLWSRASPSPGSSRQAEFDHGEPVVLPRAPGRCEEGVDGGGDATGAGSSHGFDEFCIASRSRAAASPWPQRSSCSDGHAYRSTPGAWNVNGSTDRRDRSAGRVKRVG
jgi:hypothetical protein